MPLDVLTPTPLKLHVRAVRQDPRTQVVQYELWCRLTVPRPTPTPTPRKLRFPTVDTAAETTVEWSCWKRFEEFVAFDGRMRARASPFAKMMVTVLFVPEHRVRVFFRQDQTARFLEKRRKELDYYMQRIVMLSDVAEFANGQGSHVLASFIQVQDHYQAQSVAPPPVLPTSVSPLSSCSRRSSSSLRDLHVNMGASGGPRTVDIRQQSRKQNRQEIEDELVGIYGAAEYKVFKRQAHAFRKENDVMLAANEFTAFLFDRYDHVQAEVLLQKFLGTIRSEAHREALATMIAREQRSTCSSEPPESRHSADSVQSSRSRRSRAQLGGMRPSSDKQLLEQVDLAAQGNRKLVSAFKRAAKALGNQEMSSEEFAAFLRETFGDREARNLLRMTAEAVPTPRLQQSLRNVMIP